MVKEFIDETTAIYKSVIWFLFSPWVAELFHQHCFFLAMYDSGC